MPIDFPQPNGRDLRAIARIAKRTGVFSRAEVRTVREMLKAFFDEPTDSTEYLWAVYRKSPDAPPIGFVCYGLCSFSDGAYDLYWIAVDPRYRDRGIGTALIEYVEDDLGKRNGRQLYIETSDKQNAPACAFYEKRGYERAAYFTDFYQIKDGKVIYRKILR